MTFYVRLILFIAAIFGMGLSLFFAIKHFKPDVFHSQSVQTLPTLKADIFYLNAQAITKRGSPRILVVRFNQPVAFVPYQSKEPLLLSSWQKKLNAPMVFNAGQFDEHFFYLGWLKNNHQWLSDKRKINWLGLLVSEPTTGAPFVQVLDLKHTDASVVHSYKHAIQSMMLFDQADNIRVRDTSVAACRTVVAQDSQGLMYVMFTEGAVSLGDLARYLIEADLNLVRAMNMDGGLESQVIIETPEKNLTHIGQYGSNAVLDATGVKMPLPVVVAVEVQSR